MQKVSSHGHKMPRYFVQLYGLSYQEAMVLCNKCTQCLFIWTWPITLWLPTGVGTLACWKAAILWSMLVQSMTQAHTDMTITRGTCCLVCDIVVNVGAVFAHTRHTSEVHVVYVTLWSMLAQSLHTPGTHQRYALSCLWHCGQCRRSLWPKHTSIWPSPEVCVVLSTSYLFTAEWFQGMATNLWLEQYWPHIQIVENISYNNQRLSHCFWWVTWWPRWNWVTWIMKISWGSMD